jgi:hypothetical protein
MSDSDNSSVESDKEMGSDAGSGSEAGSDVEDSAPPENASVKRQIKSGINYYLLFVRSLSMALVDWSSIL